MDTTTLLEIYNSCELRIRNNIHNLPEGSEEHKLFAASQCQYTNNLFTKLAPDKSTAFHLAVRSDSTEMLEALIEAARRLPWSSSSSTNDDAQTTALETLLRRADCQGITALLKAVVANKFEHAKLLAKADPKDRHMQTKSSPLCTAVRLRYLNIAQMIAHTCRAPAVDGALIALIPQLPEGRRRYHSTDPTDHRFVDFIQQAESESKNTALHLAVMGNRLGIVQQILMANPSYICDNNNGELKTPIYIAVEQGYKDIVQELCKHAGSSRACSEGPRKRTVLHAAVLGRDKGCVELVLNNFGMQRLQERQDEDGWTPLHHAAHSRFDSMIDIIGQRFQGSGPYISDLSSLLYREGVPSPLWMAIDQGHTSTTVLIIKLLPSLCEEVEPESRQNILHLAAEKNDKETVQDIIETCPPEYLRKILNGKDINKNTALHLLIAKGCFVKQLIEHEHINKTARNYQNWTPYDMLYFQDDIVADQLAIKRVLDEANQNSSFWIWRRSSSHMESFVPPRKRSEKDVKFKIANETYMKAEVLRYRERTNTQIIVTALITTVTFTVGFTMPGGYYQSGELNQGSVLLANETAFKAFIVSDAIALALSTTSLFLYFISSMYEDPRQVSKLNAISTGLNIFSIVGMMLTFICGIYAVLSHSPVLALAICIICSTFFVCIALLLIKLGYDRNKLKDILV
ncbi:protein ACCELERATED CELL DEATH 6-like isoform X2 [Daucus carota subsp. sativus]|uniref:protein ACCELERATED CELL DEATH 6-like isoform X2 n=1 Tax=Daucus carota subsp. sativus TaxID=79200 RepID=UPI003082E6AB